MRAMTGIRGRVEFYSIPLQLSVNQDGNEGEIQPDLLRALAVPFACEGDLVTAPTSVPETLL